MAQNQVAVSCPKGVWTQLTNSDATAITFHVLQGAVYIRFTTDTTTPTEDTGLVFSERTGVLAKSINEMTALVGADRVWAKPLASNGSILNDAVVHVDHA